MDDDFASALATLGEKPQSFAPPTQQTARPSNNPGNLRPVGASQGFQSFATPEDGLSAIDKNLLAYHKHGINSISGVINRWAPPSENNTNAYIADVSKRLSVHPDQQIDLSNPIVRQALTTAINLHENGPGILTRKSAPSAAPQQAAAPAVQPAPAAPAALDSDFTNAINMSSAPATQAAPAQPAQAPQTAQAQGVPATQSLASAMPLPGVKLASLVAQKYLPQGMNPKVDTSGVTQNQKSLGASAVALGDTLASAPGGMIKQLEYAAARALGERPEDATKRASHGLGAFLENPVSKFVNGAGKLINGTDSKIEDSAGYKGEASQGVMKFVGDNMGKGAKWISEKTGLPAADVENMMNTGVMGVAPTISKGVGKVGSSAARYIDGLNQEMAGTKPLSSMLKAGESPTPASSGTTMSLSGMAPEKPAYKLINGKPVLIEPDQSIPAVTPPIGSAKPLGSALSVPPEPQAPLPTMGDKSGWNLDTSVNSEGAASATLDSRFAKASPQMQVAYEAAKKKGAINPLAAERHLEADSLNAGVELTPGMSSGNPHLISDERNNRADYPGYAERFASNDLALKTKLESIRKEIAPDVYSTGPTNSGEQTIKSYLVKDAVKNKEISANYQALEDANGGTLPMDVKAFLDNSDAALAKKLKTDYVPSDIRSQLEKFRAKNSMNFEQSEALRSNIGADIAEAKRAGKGNAAYSLGIILKELENMPLTPEAAHLKPLADKARNSAKARFDSLAEDPAYDSAVNGTTTADKFMDKYVINGSREEVRSMRNNLSHDPRVQQLMGSHTIEWLKKKSGIIDGNGTLSQSGLNTNMLGIREKLPDMVGAEAADTLHTLGKVARYAQERTPGSYVNESNTTPSAIKRLATGSMVKVGNMSVPFAALGTSAADYMKGRAKNQEIKKTLEPGAGLVNLKDLGK